MALSKAEVNARFYDAVGGEILFETEAQGYLHPYAVAKLVAARARGWGTRALKLLELGANNCAFATTTLKLLTALTVAGDVDLNRIDYFAVELARGALDTFLSSQDDGDFQSVAAGAIGSPLVGTLRHLGRPQSNLHLVHSEAGAFVSGGSGRYDVVVLNELLDDLPSRVFYSDAAGSAYELTAQASEEEGGRWRVQVSAERAPGVELPPRMLTATSRESLAVVRGAAAHLESGGMLLIHDYGFVERYTPVENYEAPPKSLPDFVTLEFPPGSESGFPRSFFRIFGNEKAHVVQITTDVAFAELIEELEQHGRVITLPHGNALISTRDRVDDFRKGDGVFLSEFAGLEPGDDLGELLAHLGAEQEELRRRFSDTYLEGSASVFADLLFVKS